MEHPRTKTIAIYLAAALLALALLAFGARLVSQVRGAGEAWSEYTTRAAEAESVLHDVIHHFGYGGFIHHFKNYVLRSDPALLHSLEDDLAATRAALDRFERLPLSAEERQALADLGNVVDRYAAKMEVARVLVAQGLTPREIDLQVRVDDAPAVAAIGVLQARVEKVLADSQRDTQQALANVARELWYGVALLLPIGLVAAVLVRDRRAMRHANERLTQNARYIQDLLEGVPDPLLVIGENGRIQRTNAAAEKLLGYKRDALLKLAVEDLIPQRMREGHVALRERTRAMADEKPFREGVKLMALARDGREIPVDISLSHSRLDDDLLTLVTLRDVTERERLAGLLEERREALQAAQAIAHIGSWDWHVVSNTLSWTDETYRIFGHEPQAFAVTYDTFLEHVHGGDREWVAAAVKAALEEGVPYQVEHRIVRADGSEGVVQQRAEVFRADGGQPVRMIGTVLDVTERKAAERELLFDKAIIEGLSQPILVVDAELRIVGLNDAFCEMSGYGRDEVMGQSPSLLKSGRHGQDYYQQMWQSIEQHQYWRGEIWNRRKDGGVMPQLLSITRICEPQAQQCRYVGFYSDITSLKENEARLEKLAHFDQLTGLANRMLCHDRLRAAIARAHRSGHQVAALFVDLDGFKQVNDRLGHQTGDMLLVEVAERLKHSVREDDTVARLGGDEFAVVLNEVEGRDEIGLLAGRVLEATRLTLGGGALSVSSSIGIACFPGDGETEDLLLERADQAMYRAKQAGKGRWVFFGDE